MRKPSLRCSLSLDGTRVRCSFGPGSDSCVDVVAHYIAKAVEGSVCARDVVGDVGQGIR